MSVAVQGEVLKDVLCGLGFAVLGYATFASLSGKGNKSKWDGADDDFLPSAVRDRRGTDASTGGASAVAAAAAPTFLHPGPLTLASGPLGVACADVLPLLERIDPVKAEEMVHEIEGLVECLSESRTNKSPLVLARAQANKRNATRALQYMNKQGRRTLPFETLDSLDALHNVVTCMQDVTHNVMQEHALRLSGD
jgi:hypothetical protein